MTALAFAEHRTRILPIPFLRMSVKNSRAEVLFHREKAMTLIDRNDYSKNTDDGS